MSRRLVALAVAGAVVLAGAGATAAPTRASLRLVRQTPVTVRGAGFQPHEGVVLTLWAGRRAVARARAGADGSFVAAFRGTALARCSGFTLTAVGTAGTRAFLKRPFPPACLPVKRSPRQLKRARIVSASSLSPTFSNP
jgi:hypothetical protein